MITTANSKPNTDATIAVFEVTSHHHDDRRSHFMIPQKDEPELKLEGIKTSTLALLAESKVGTTENAP